VNENNRGQETRQDQRIRIRDSSCEHGATPSWR